MQTPEPGQPRRKWIGVQFDCCNVYNRAYQNKEGTEYNSSCPKCGRRVRFTVGSGGTDSRFFSAQ